MANPRNRIMRTTALVLLTSAAIVVASPARATTYAVGVGAGCTHGTMASAIAAAVADATTGPHLIKVVTGTRFVNDLAIDNPAQDIEISGGFTACADAAPASGARTILNNNDVAGRRLMEIANANSNPRRQVVLRRLTLTGGLNPTGLNFGGAMLITGRATVYLRDDTRIEGNTAGSGGGVALVNLTSDPTLFSEIFLQSTSRIEDNQATGSGTAGNGGGVYALGGARVVLWDGSVGFNTARRAGGGISLGDGIARLSIDPFLGSELVSIHNNTAGQPVFSATEGFGGGIHSAGGEIAVTHLGGASAYGLWMFNNEANVGGAIHATGTDAGARSIVSITNAFVFNNTAADRGGALYSLNGVQWTIDHNRTGDCATLGQRAPCSQFLGNQANLAGGSAVGGGVMFLASDPGSQGGIANFERTLFSGNADPNGLAAVAEATTGSRLNFRRSVFRNNSAGGPGTQKTLIGSTGTGVDFYYNTVLANSVDALFFISGGELRPQGSIWWAPGTTLWIPANGATMPFVTSCLVTHTTTGLGSGPAAAAWVADPRLNSRFVPRASSPAIDHCSESLDPGTDLYGRPTRVDVPGVSNRIGIADLGAVEQDDVVFGNSFGTRPTN
jgi:predicted outer membrane repeat protein